MLNKIIAVLVVVFIVVVGIGVAVYFNKGANQGSPVTEEAVTSPTVSDDSSNNIHGVVTSVSDDFIEINSDGNVHRFDISEATLPDDKVAVDDVVDIVYSGELSDNTKAINVSIVNESSSSVSEDSSSDTTEPTTTATPASSGANHYITGKVVDVTMNAITITANRDGKNYSFSTIDANMDNNIAVGDSVKVVHSGLVSEQDGAETIPAVSVQKNR